MQCQECGGKFIIREYAIVEHIQALENRLATLRDLWTSLPAGTREGLREYHLATYRQWCAALGVSDA